MATENDQNLFASPWNDSDVVLVVEDQELHVHKWILTLQSPVFKAMFDGHFKEASQDKITLKDRDFKSMLQFLTILYPSSTFGEDRVSLDDESLASVLALADKYQCVNLIKQCINEVKITPENVLPILPYVVKYHQTALPRLYDVINRSVPTAKLEEILPKVESKEISSTMLLTKCCFMETNVVKMKEAVLCLICDFLQQKKMLVDSQQSIKRLIQQLQDSKAIPTSSGSYFGGYVPQHSVAAPRDTSTETTGDSRCPHNVRVLEMFKTKGCPTCKEKYKEKFLAPIPSCVNAENYFNMLETGNDVAIAVNLKT